LKDVSLWGVPKRFETDIGADYRAFAFIPGAADESPSHALMWLLAARDADIWALRTYSQLLISLGSIIFPGRARSEGRWDTFLTTARSHVTPKLVFE
jgi:hypothetical protein